MKRIWMLIGKSSRCKWASSHLSSCPRCPRPAAREKPVVRQLRNEWSPTTGHAALNVYIILDNAHIVQRTVIEIPKIYFEKGIVQRIWNGCNIVFFPTSSFMQNYLLPFKRLNEHSSKNWSVSTAKMCWWMIIKQFELPIKKNQDLWQHIGSNEFAS